jgi:anti-sigma B factor antagonist
MPMAPSPHGENMKDRTNWMNMHHEDLSIHVHVVNGMNVFELTGSMDIATSPTVRAALTEASERGDHKIIVDLSNVDFLDSTGLGALLGAQKRAKEYDGDVRLVAQEGQILRLLRITGLMKIFSVYPTLEDAVSNGTRVGDL